MPDTSSNDTDALYKAIGFIVINWALIESALDSCVTLIYHNLGGNELEAEKPRNFDRKYKFLKKAFNRLPNLAEFKDSGIDVAERMNSFATQRHNLVHGAVSSFVHQNGVYEFSLFNKDITDGLYRTELFDLTQFPQIAKSLTALCRDSLVLAHQLLDRFPQSPQ